MVDEYQDTNRSQYDLMRLLTRAAPQHLRGRRRRPVDLRLARREHPQHPGLRARFPRRHHHPPGAELPLDARPFSKPPAPWSPTTPSASAKGCGPTPAQAKRSRSTKRRIPKTKPCGSPTPSRARLARNPQERVAVLYRTNSQSRQIEEALRRYGRKYVVVGGFSFYQRAEVKDILAYLKVLVSPQDSISLLRIINTPARGIGRTTIEQIEQYALATRTLAVDLARANARSPRLPRPRRSRSGGIPSHDDRTRRAARNAPHRATRWPMSSNAPAIARCSKTKAPRNRASAWRTWTNCSTPRPMRRARRISARFPGSRRAGLRRRFRRLARPGVAAHHAQRQGPGIPGRLHRGPGRRACSRTAARSIPKAEWKRSAACATSA